MAKSKKTTSSEKIFILFQHKTFTILFFLGIFALLGGAFYLMQSSAASVVNVRGCTVSGKGAKNSGGYIAGAYLDTRYLGGGPVSTSGKFSFTLSDLDKLSNQIVITYGTATKGGPLATVAAGPCL